MATKIFLNLPVKNLEVTKKFFTRLGYAFNPQYNGENARCMIINEVISIMMMREPFFQRFILTQQSEEEANLEKVITLPAKSREEVDKIINLAVAGGATLLSAPNELEWMYCRGFLDLDGHCWEVMFMESL